MIDKRIKFEESVISAEHGTITLYFTGPKELLGRDYPEAEAMELSIECPREYISADYANVEISPTRYVEEDDSYEDYDWREVSLLEGEVEELIKLAEESGRI